MNSFDYIEKDLRNLRQNHLIRKPRIFNSAQLPRSIVDGKKVLLFSSGNYLSLCEDKELMTKAFEKALDYGMGSGGSRLTTGSCHLHQKLEDEICEFLNYRACLLFSSGYMANIGVLSSICDENTVIFSDQYNHASIIDGIRLSKGKTVVYRHLDYDDLEKKLALYSQWEKKVLVSDGLFSMNGDLLNVNRFIQIGKRYKALTIVDDAHGFGALGHYGRGVCDLYEEKPDLLVGTFSKAIGVEGAFVATSSKIKQFLLHHARSYIFSTSLSPFSIASIGEVLHHIREDQEKLKKLAQNVKFLVGALREIGIFVEGKHHIIPILIGDEEKALQIGQKMLEMGIYVSVIRYPAVEYHRAILRITLMADHREEDLQQLVSCLKEMNKRYPFIK
ncbi:MAG: aminotransferase class I/II-fold pyridoxal phosphate-dependent enzyme [Tissierellia bacterium]|nr:aminotransferase class I/II-fold pyridoxal phosphate-dependent enzyme [Tissierellia bacterium]